MLSVVIPSYRDPYLVQTVQSVLRHATGPVEVVAVLDGYWRADLPSDPRVRVVHLGTNGGMRHAINVGVRVSTGTHLMRLDEHIDMSPGFDTVLLDGLGPGEIRVPRQYALDPTTWTRIGEDYTDYHKLIIDPHHKKFAGQPWRTRTAARAALTLDENMAFQGSCWVMARQHWDTVIGELQSEGYGTHYQDSVEMLMKTWQAGGTLRTHKGAWFAHKHRSFKRTHTYGGQPARASWAYALRIWGDYYRDVIQPRWALA